MVGRSLAVFAVVLVGCGREAPRPASPAKAQASLPATGEEKAQREGIVPYDACIAASENARVWKDVDPPRAGREYLRAKECFQRSGRLRQAMVAARDALTNALYHEDFESTDAARQAVQDVIRRLPRIRTSLTGGSVDQASLDGKPLPTNELRGGSFIVDPGRHRIVAKGHAPNGREVEYVGELVAVEGQELPWLIELR